MRGWRIKDNLAAHWPLQSAVGVITPDVSGRGYPGTLVNVPTWGVGPFGGLQCVELDGLTQHVNVGDVTQLNAVSAFTICFWMNQDILDVTDVIFIKISGADLIEIDTNANGNMYCRPLISGSSRGYFDYSAAVSAANWHHIAWVFDGTQAVNASRLVVYVDGAPIALSFDGTIAAATANLAGVDAFIGYSSTSFDGRLWDMRLLTVAATRDEINQIIRSPVPYLV